MAFTTKKPIRTIISNDLAVKVAGRVASRHDRIKKARNEAKLLHKRLEYLNEYIQDAEETARRLGSFTEVFDGIALCVGVDYIGRGTSIPCQGDVSALAMDIKRHARVYSNAHTAAKDGTPHDFCLSLFTGSYPSGDKCLMLQDHDFQAVLMKAKIWVAHGPISFTGSDILAPEKIAAQALAK